MVVDKISIRYFGIGGVEILVVDILRIFGVIGEVLWGKVSAIEAAGAWNRVIIPCKILKSPTYTSYFYFIIVFLFNFSSFPRP